VNQADSEGIVAELAARGLASADDHKSADVVIINSCTVTHRSDADVRKLVARVHRENPGAKVVITGCYAQRDPDALVKIKGTSAVVGHSNAHELGDVVAKLVKEAPTEPIILRGDLDDLPPLSATAVAHDRTRPFVKIQDGCDARCTYCVIPSVRGPARSAPPEQVLDSIAKLIARGDQEIVLTGVHLGKYPAFVDLVKSALALPGLKRLRLSSIEPMAFDKELVTLARDDARLAPHFHLPLQSGSDRVLKRMNRPYRSRDFAEIVRHIRAELPDACIGTDVITGFPGETDEEAQASAEMIATVDYAHVFSYSDRPGVPSTRLPDKIDPATIKARAAISQRASDASWARFLDRFVGRELEVLTLQSPPGVTHALSPHYCPVHIAGEIAPNTQLSVRVERRDGARLTAAVRPAAP